MLNCSLAMLYIECRDLLLFPKYSLLLAICMAQEGRDSNLSDSDADGLGEMPIDTPSRRWDLLFEYLPKENAGSSIAGLWRSSSVGAVCPTGHNSNSSQARFDGGEHYFGDVEFPAAPEGREAGSCP